jgi:hypothetical protein
MTSSRVGMRYNDGSGTPSQYVKHPPAASSFWANGDALDAGTAQDVDQNISHLTAENFRPLVEQPGPGLLADHTNPSNLWGGLADLTGPPGGVTPDALLAVPWSTSRPNCFRWGPFYAIVDNDSPAGWLTFRKVQFDVEVNTAGSELKVYVAMTTTPNPPSESYIDGTFQTMQSPFGGGPQRLSTKMEPTPPAVAYAGTPRTCRPPTAGLNRSLSLAEFWIWMAYVNGSAGSNTMQSISAFEVP